MNIGTLTKNVSSLISRYITFDFDEKKQLFLYCNSVQCVYRTIGHIMTSPGQGQILAGKRCSELRGTEHLYRMLNRRSVCS